MHLLWCSGLPLLCCIRLPLPWWSSGLPLLLCSGLPLGGVAAFRFRGVAACRFCFVVACRCFDVFGDGFSFEYCAIMFSFISLIHQALGFCYRHIPATCDEAATTVGRRRAGCTQAASQHQYPRLDQTSLRSCEAAVERRCPDRQKGNGRAELEEALGMFSCWIRDVSTMPNQQLTWFVHYGIADMV